MEFSEGMKKELTATGAQSVLTGAAAVGVDNPSNKKGAAAIKDQSGGKEPKAKGKAKEKAKGKADSTPGNKPAPTVDKVAKALKECHETKKIFAAATASAVDISNAIENEAAWQMWVTDGVKQQLKQEVAKVQACLSPFHRDFVRTSDQKVAYWKNIKDEAVLITEFRNFAKARGAFEHMLNFCQKLNRSHKEMSQL
jgi:hypothetical protein